MLSRRSALFSAVAATAAFAAPAFATETEAFTPDAFAAAQKAGKPIFVAIHASWCPTCAAAKASGVKASVSVANARAAKAAVAATAVNSAERRESMIEVLLAFNVVVLQRALVARSHKLPGTHQLSVN